MLPDAVIARAVRMLLCASTLALVFVATPALRAQGAPQAGPAPDHAELRPRRAVDVAEGVEAGVRHQCHAALARDRAIGSGIPTRPARAAGSTSSIRSRRRRRRSSITRRWRRRSPRLRAFPTTRRICRSRTVTFREEGHGVRVQLPGAGHREHQLGQATRDHDRAATAAGRRIAGGGRARREAQQGSGRGAAWRGAAAPPRNKTLLLRVRHGHRDGSTLLEDYKVDPRQPRWASLSPDNKTSCSRATTTST